MSPDEARLALRRAVLSGEPIEVEHAARRLGWVMLCAALRRAAGALRLPLLGRLRAR
jgi:hypothetical protein